jgi:YidC/Oxa1 family membrane protein insertase
MDRNSAIGLSLMAVLLVAYFFWFAPQPAPDQAAQPQNPPAATEEPSGRKLENPQDTLNEVTPQQKEELATIETEDLLVTFSTRGGIMKEVSLKKYTSYRDYKNARDYDRETERPLKLISPERTSFQLLTQLQGKQVDLYKQFYQVQQRKDGDTTLVIFTGSLDNGSSFTQTYRIPAKGYEIGYSISQSGLDPLISSDNLSFQWSDDIKPLEKDLQDTRIYTTITYFTAADGFDELAERSTDNESESLTQPVQWATIKQKFFLSSIIAKKSFSGGEVSTIFPGDTSVVKHASVKLFIPKASLSDGKEDFKFYIGPNDYQVIGSVADDFKKNVYLGWPPVHWINKYVIFPVFHLLTKVISNYGLIIIILVILLKLVLAPLSYRSYLSMAKMKVLKPDLDLIKEKNGEDMAKVQQEQLKLYQSVGVNPISGCVPVLLQMPILFAMFYLFPASIELRQQPFLWAEDLSTYDSLIQLPFTIPFGVGDHVSLFTLLMTISTLIYTWQNNQISSVTGPMKSMSYIMPVIFFFVLNSFSSGLTFYYFVSNLVTFAQQAIIRRFVDESKIKLLLEENRKKNAAGGGGKKSKFMSRLEDAMKASEEAKRKAQEERKKKK